MTAQPTKIITIADLITKSEVIEKYHGIGDSTFYKWLRKGIIPKPVDFPPETNNKMWIEAEVDAKLARDLERCLEKRAAAG